MCAQRPALLWYIAAATLKNILPLESISVLVFVCVCVCEQHFSEQLKCCEIVNIDVSLIHQGIRDIRTDQEEGET